jgi:hypothetical protein
MWASLKIQISSQYCVARKKLLLTYSAIDTLLRSSRLREMAHAVIPAPDGSAAPRHDRTYASSQFSVRALSCLELWIFRTINE